MIKTVFKVLTILISSGTFAQDFKMIAKDILTEEISDHRTFIYPEEFQEKTGITSVRESGIGFSDNTCLAFCTSVELEDQNCTLEVITDNSSTPFQDESLCNESAYIKRKNGSLAPLYKTLENYLDNAMASTNNTDKQRQLGQYRTGIFVQKISTIIKKLAYDVSEKKLYLLSASRDETDYMLVVITVPDELMNDFASDKKTENVTENILCYAGFLFMALTGYCLYGIAP
jgi:hypothetical protein